MCPNAAPNRTPLPSGKTVTNCFGISWQRSCSLLALFSRSWGTADLMGFSGHNCFPNPKDTQFKLASPTSAFAQPKTDVCFCFWSKLSEPQASCSNHANLADGSRNRAPLEWESQLINQVLCGFEGILSGLIESSWRTSTFKGGTPVLTHTHLPFANTPPARKKRKETN